MGRRIGGPRAGPPRDREARSGTDLVAGKNPVLEALRSDRAVHRILLARADERDPAVRAILAEASRRGVPVVPAEPRELDELVAENHQGIVAFAEPRGYVDLAHLLRIAEERGEPPFILLLDGIEDPHNLGAILRVADGAGVHGVVIPDRGAVGLSPGVFKASAGAAEHVPVARVTNLMDALVKLRKAGVWIGGAAMDEGKVYWDERLTGPLAIVMGNEGEGLSHPVAKHCDFFVRIPMRGKVDSLNVSVATALLVYERARQSAAPQSPRVQKDR